MNRIDNIKEVNEWKFNRAADIYNEMDCQFTIHGGYLFDSWTPDVETLRIVTNYVDKTGKFVLLPGNHDLPPGANPKQFYDTIFSVVMEVSNNIRVFSKSMFFFNEELELKPIHFTRQFGTIFMIPTTAKTLALFTHLLIDNKGSFTPVDSIITNADLFFASHTHDSFDVIHDGTRFYNPGVFIRRRSNEATAKPKVAVVEFFSPEMYKITDIDLFAPKPKFRVRKNKLKEEVTLVDMKDIAEEVLQMKEQLDMRTIIAAAYKQKGSSALTQETVENFLYEAQHGRLRTETDKFTP